MNWSAGVALTRGRLTTACAVLASMAIAASSSAIAAGAAIDIVVVGDAVPRPLTTTPGDPARGRAIVADRQTGLCLLCHTGPFPDERFQGTLAPDLAGAGARWSEGQLRLRIVDARHLNPETVMPSYHRVVEGRRVGSAWRGKPVLDPQQIEDVVAFLVTLRP